MDLRNMTQEQHDRALTYLMFLKQKWCHFLNSGGFFDGRGQHEFISKDKMSAPIRSFYALLIACMIDVDEGRFVATAYIPRLFLQTD